MAKNRSSNVNPLEGLTNISKPTADHPKPIVSELKEGITPPEEVQPVVKAAEIVKEVVRKKTKTETSKKFTVYVSDEVYMFLKKNGWEHNGMNGFINHLIIEEMKRRGE